MRPLAAGHRCGGVGDRLLIALPDGTWFGSRDERCRCGGIGDRQRGVELTRGERERLGVVEDGGQLGLAVVDRRRCGEGGEPPRIARTMPIVRMRPGGGEEPPAGWAGSIGDPAACGSIDGCASSTFTPDGPRFFDRWFLCSVLSEF